MSLTGLAIESWRPLEIGRRYDITLRHEEEAVSFEAEVQWSHLVRTEKIHPDQSAPLYQAGLDFRDVLDDRALDILAFLEHNVVLQLERRVFGRFKVDLTNPAAFGEHHDFVVKQLSFSGMLIETDLLLEPGSDFDMEVETERLKLETHGHVTHSERRPRAAYRCYQAGVAFDPMPARPLRTLEEMIEGFLE